MHRFVMGVALLAGLAFLTSTVSGQSMSNKLTGTPVTIEGMKSATASSWKAAKAEKPEIAKFTMPKAGREPEDAVMVVQPLEGKDEDNIETWKKMFKPSKGDKFEDSDIRTQKKKIGDVNITLVEINGTYLDKKGASPQDKQKYRMYATIFEAKGKKYAITAVGPVNTMKRHGTDFRAFLASFK